MEKDEKQHEKFSWVKNSLIPIIIIIFISIYLNNKIENINTTNIDSTTPSKVTIDFQNESSVARIKTSFIDILVGSAGSKKRDNGYELLLLIINPSSIALRNIKSNFQHSSSYKTASCSDIKMIIYPGKSKILKCFISDLSDSDLKSIEVMVNFDQISSH